MTAIMRIRMRNGSYKMKAKMKAKNIRKVTFKRKCFCRVASRASAVVVLLPSGQQSSRLSILLNRQQTKNKSLFY